MVDDGLGAFVDVEDDVGARGSPVMTGVTGATSRSRGVAGVQIIVLDVVAICAMVGP